MTSYIRIVQKRRKKGLQNYSKCYIVVNEINHIGIVIMAECCDNYIHTTFYFKPT